MRSEDEVQAGVNPGVMAALKALGDADRGLEAPPAAEGRLRAAFQVRTQESRIQGNRERDGRVRWWRWVPAVAAAAILAIVAIYYRGPRVEVLRVAVPVRTSSSASAEPVVQRQTDRAEPGILRARTANTAVRRAARVRDSQPRAQTQEIATDFFPLVEFAPPTDNGELVRVNLPASAMRDVGLPVREDRLDDRVQADVLVSNGVATAIRFVKNMQ